MGDHDGRQKWVGGIVQFERAQSEKSITHYNASWLVHRNDERSRCCGGGWRLLELGTWYSPNKPLFIEGIITTTWPQVSLNKVGLGLGEDYITKSPNQNSTFQESAFGESWQKYHQNSSRYQQPWTWSSWEPTFGWNRRNPEIFGLNFGVAFCSIGLKGFWPGRFSWHFPPEGHFWSLWVGLLPRGGFFPLQYLARFIGMLKAREQRTGLGVNLKSHWFVRSGLELRSLVPNQGTQ